MRGIKYFTESPVYFLLYIPFRFSYIRTAASPITPASNFSCPTRSIAAWRGSYPFSGLSMAEILRRGFAMYEAAQ
jgi:hypothetical protein